MAVDRILDAVIRKSWRALKRNWVWLLEASVVTFLVSVGLSVVALLPALYAMESYPMLSAIYAVTVVSAILVASSNAVTIAAMDAVDSGRKDMYSVFSRAASRTPAMMVYSAALLLFAVLSVFLLAIPLLLAVPYIVVSRFLILRGSGVVESVRESFRILKGRWKESMAVFILISFLSSLVSATFTVPSYLPETVAFAVAAVHMVMVLWFSLFMSSVTSLVHYVAAREFGA